MKIERSGSGEIDQIATQPWQLWTPLSHRERLTWLVKRGILVKRNVKCLKLATISKLAYFEISLVLNPKQSSRHIIPSQRPQEGGNQQILPVRVDQGLNHLIHSCQRVQCNDRIESRGREDVVTMDTCADNQMLSRTAFHLFTRNTLLPDTDHIFVCYLCSLKMSTVIKCKDSELVGLG